MCLSVVLMLIIEACWELSPLGFFMGLWILPSFGYSFKDTHSAIRGRIIVGKWAEAEVRGTVFYSL